MKRFDCFKAISSSMTDELVIRERAISTGKPDIYYVERKFKCEVCGGKADKMGFKKIVKILKRAHNRDAFKSQRSNFSAIV